MQKQDLSLAKDTNMLERDENRQNRGRGEHRGKDREQKSIAPLKWQHTCERSRSFWMNDAATDFD